MSSMIKKKGRKPEVTVAPHLGAEDKQWDCTEGKALQLVLCTNTAGKAEHIHKMWVHKYKSDPELKRITGCTTFNISNLTNMINIGCIYVP